MCALKVNKRLSIYLFCNCFFSQCKRDVICTWAERARRSQDYPWASCGQSERDESHSLPCCSTCCRLCWHWRFWWWTPADGLIVMLQSEFYCHTRMRTFLGQAVDGGEWYRHTLCVCILSVYLPSVANSLYTWKHGPSICVENKPRTSTKSLHLLDMYVYSKQLSPSRGGKGYKINPKSPFHFIPKQAKNG